MLEIILLIYLTRHVGETVEAKGRKAGWYKVLTVVLWLGCEIGGAIVGGIIAALSGSGNLVVYLFALVGAAVGAGISILIARSVSPLAYDQPPPPPTFG
jgi:uncharacterized membrane protein YeaQ/YmgE (transglycosylase-associated protein family)